MALPMLINGADCGPSNALQGLMKNLERDRGLQQDFFGAGRAGSSRETFRTTPAPAPGLGQEAAQFFSSQSAQGPAFKPDAFNLASIRDSIPQSTQQWSQARPQVQTHAPTASWAVDFLVQGKTASPVSAQASTPMQQQQHEQQQRQVMASPGPSMQFQSYNVPMMSMSMNQTHTISLPTQVQRALLTTQLDPSALDQAFHTHANTFVEQQPITQEPTTAQRIHDDDELARTAGQIVDAVGSNPKFKQSSFMGLMRQLRDHDVVVSGNDMVARSEAQPEATTSSSRPEYAYRHPSQGAYQTHVLSPSQSGLSLQPTLLTRGKGKGRAVDVEMPPLTHEDTTLDASDSGMDAYWEQENANLADYWGAHHSRPDAQARVDEESKEGGEWGRLQADWEAFEATTTGVRAVGAEGQGYAFQANNPYLQGWSTRTHALHGRPTQAFLESMLQLEAAVQREPTNARAWFDLGVKQQENERESLALSALRRAVGLDPEHLPAWLALATASTNEGLRGETVRAVREWIVCNERYSGVVAAHGGPGETMESVVQCLIAIARAGGADVDADVQVALGVLLNADEDYEKARDCFHAALGVRPDDWVLYNRVGATLANSGGSENATAFYYRALELNPAYIRARFNLGISCINLGRYTEAAQHILDALVLQDGDGVAGADTRGVTSSSLWDSLRTTCLHMKRIDWAAYCDHRDLDGIRREIAQA
ncbi:TPR-like protein [Peniophora sp. CONT]|nr:TPR-like protein [Peniophora sp. CONT]